MGKKIIQFKVRTIVLCNILLLFFTGLVSVEQKSEIRIFNLDLNEKSAGSKRAYLSGELQLARGNLKEAEKIFEALLAKAESNEEKINFLRPLLRIFHKQKRYEEIAGIKNDFKDDLESQLIFVQAYLNIGRRAEALKLLEELASVSKYQDNGKVMYLAAVKFLEQKEFKKALSIIDIFLSKVNIQTKHVIFYWLKGSILANLGQWESALNIVKDGLKVADNYKLHFLKFKIYFHLGRMTEALYALKETLRVNTEFQKGWRIWSMLSEKIGNIEDAIFGYKKLQEFSGFDPSLVKKVMELLLLQGKCDEAVRELRRMLKGKYLFAALTDLYTRTKQYSKALAMCKKVLWFTSDDLMKSRLLYQMGHIYLIMKNYKKSREMLEKAVALSHVYFPAYNLLAYLYAFQNDNLEQALKLARKAVKFSPQNATFVDTEGLVLLKLGKKREAQAQFEKALHLSPHDKVIQGHLQLAR